MENQVYRIRMSDEYKLELYVCDTNELNPHRDIKEIGVVVYKDGEQIDGDIDEMELDSLIKYLTKCKEYISKFNANSKSTCEHNVDDLIRLNSSGFKCKCGKEVTYF